MYFKKCYFVLFIIYRILFKGRVCYKLKILFCVLLEIYCREGEKGEGGK